MLGPWGQSRVKAIQRVGRDDELQAGTQTAHETPAAAGVMRASYAEHGPVVNEVHFTGQAERAAP